MHGHTVPRACVPCAGVRTRVCDRDHSGFGLPYKACLAEASSLAHVRSSSLLPPASLTALMFDKQAA